MTTQELKNKIEKVLGNNIRCLLPSYWWKNLFHSVADRIDEVEQSTSQLIDSKANKVLKEAKMPIVESVDELSKLDLPKGGVAAVEKVGEPVVVNLEDCYLSADAATDWDKYTIIRGFSEKGAPSNSVGQIHLFSDKSMENGLTIACGEGEYFYYKIANGRTYYSSLEEVNEYLASGKYRLVFGYFIENISAYVTLYSQIPQPNLYIKGASWERLAKEGDITGEGGNTSGDGLIFGKERYAYVSKHGDVNGNIAELELSEEQKAYNQETNEMLKSGEKVYLSYKGTFWTQVGYSASNSNYTFYFSTASMFLPNDNRVFGRFIALSSDGEIALADTLVGGSSSDITVDTEMSSTSTNPVQNKVVYSELQKKQDTISDLADIRSGAALGKTALQSEQYKGTITGVSANGTSVATSGVANIPAASTSAYGVTKLSSATNSTSTSLAATASAVKAAYDLANNYKGTVTGVKINGTTKNPSSGIVDLGTVITAHQDISHLATKEELNSLTNEIISNERVHAASLVDIDARIQDIVTRLNNAGL